MAARQAGRQAGATSVELAACDGLTNARTKAAAAAYCLLLTSCNACLLLFGEEEAVVPAQAEDTEKVLGGSGVLCCWGRSRRRGKVLWRNFVNVKCHCDQKFGVRRDMIFLDQSG